MRKAWKKAVSVLLTLVLIFGVLPGMNVSAEDEGGQGSGNSVEITLDNGTYDDTYKNKYGTIQYSTNYRDNSTSAEWKEISELTASDNQGKSKYTTFLCNFVLPFWDSSLHFSASATYRTFLRSMTENTIIRDHTLAMTN